MDPNDHHFMKWFSHLGSSFICHGENCYAILQPGDHDLPVTSEGRSAYWYVREDGPEHQEEPPLASGVIQFRSWEGRREDLIAARRFAKSQLKYVDQQIGNQR